MSVVLDPATDALLAQMRQGGGKPLYEQTVEEVRAMISGSSAMLAGPTIEVASAIDRTIPGPRDPIPVRIYTPTGASASTRSITVYFHGGGFAGGDLDTHDGTCRYLCQNANSIVISVHYRRPPEHRFPAAVDDAFVAVEWAAAHGAEAGGDGARLAVAGDSAGGNLATVVCQLAKERGGPRIIFQILFYPVVDQTCAPSVSRSQFGGGDFFLSNRDIEWFRDLYLTDATQRTDPRVSPLLSKDLGGLPPALIVAAGCDPLLDEGKAYADRLSAAGVAVEYRCFEGTIHAFASFCGAIPLGKNALALAAARLRSALHG